jgi:UDP-N-acetylmuramate dehydrogenase
MPLTAGLEEFVRPNEPLAPRTWFRVGGAAEFFATPRTEDELLSVIHRCRDEGTPLRLLGGGSNVLVRDEGVSGVVLHLSSPAFSAIRVQGTTLVAGGGARLGHLISTSVREGFAGLEALVGIPGTVGGALHTNAGGRSGDAGQFASAATVITRGGDVIVRQRDEMVFAYRQSSLDELVILSAEFQLDKGDPEELTRRMQKQWILKKAEQPMGHEPTGRIFKSPRGMSAENLVDQAGLKGTRVGGAEVCDRHPNFIIVDESGAKSDDVIRLIDLMRSRVVERLGVELELELEIW